MMSKRNKIILILIIVLAVLVLVFGCNRAKTQEEVQTQTTAQTEQTAAEEEQTTTTEPTEVQTTETTQSPKADYRFRNYDRLKEHYKKHGQYMGFDSPEDYLAAANAVISNPDALTKTEKEDGDYLYYVEDTNEFVVLSTDGYIRTYFCPDSGKRYFDKQ